MKKVILTGIIDTHYFNGFTGIALIQEDGYKIDLISRFIEASNSFGSTVQVSYYISDKACTKNEMIEKNLLRISGAIFAEYEKHDFQYSSWTSDTSYTEELRIGKHDLYQELKERVGKFIILELNFKG